MLKFKQVFIGSSGVVYGLTEDGKIYRYCEYDDFSDKEDPFKGTWKELK